MIVTSVLGKLETNLKMYMKVARCLRGFIFL